MAKFEPPVALAGVAAVIGVIALFVMNSGGSPVVINGLIVFAFAISMVAIILRVRDIYRAR